MIATALLAAAAMVASCVLSVIAVQSESANKGWLAGFASAFGFLASFTYTKISLNASGGAQVLTLGCVFLAVIVGTKLGADVGRHILHLRLTRRYRRHASRYEIERARRSARAFRHPRKGLM